MKFINEKGDEISLADNLTLQELAELGMQITVVDQCDPNLTHWLSNSEQQQTSDAEYRPKL